MSCLLIVWKEDIQPLCHGGGSVGVGEERTFRAGFLGRWRNGDGSVRALWAGRHRACCGRATSRARWVAVLLGLVVGMPCVAQPGNGAAENAGVRLVVAALPTPAQTMAAFEELSALVVAIRAPDTGAFSSAGVPGAASITLRLDGQLLARVTTAGPGCLHEAARQTIEILDQRSRGRSETIKPQTRSETGPDEVLVVLKGPPVRPLLRGLDTERVRISLELAGPLVPFRPKTLDEVDRQLARGLDGVGVRVSSTTEVVFPGAMLTLNIGPGDGLTTAIARATGDVGLGVRGNPDAEPGVLGTSKGAVFFRFRTVHVANPDEGVPPIFLFRGGRVVREREISTASLRLFADLMARNLIARRMTDGTKRGMVGTVLPTLGRFERESASPVEQALAGLALVRYSERFSREDAAWVAARTRAAEILDQLAVIEEGEADPLAGFACAALAVSVFEDVENFGLPGAAASDSVRGFLERCRARLSEGAASMEAVPESERGLVAFALARRAAGTKLVEDVSAAERAVGEVLGGTPLAQLVNQMPWIGWAALALADAKGGAVSSATALREMRETVFAHALSVDAAGPDGGDLVGGIVFSTSGPALPTWQSARPLAFIATMLGDRRVTDAGEVVKEQARLLPSLRFLRQLETDEAAGHLCLWPGGARGGVRVAVWDQRQPADATSLTLLTVCEALRGFEGK